MPASGNHTDDEFRCVAVHIQKNFPGHNEIKHAARVLSRYRDARRTRILRIRLRLTVRVKKLSAAYSFPADAADSRFTFTGALSAEESRPVSHQAS